MLDERALPQLLNDLDTLAEYERATAALARFDAVMDEPDVRRLWLSYALPDEAAALARLAGGETSRPWLRCVVADTQPSRISQSDRFGLACLDALGKLHDLSGARPDPARLSAFCTAIARGDNTGQGPTDVAPGHFMPSMTRAEDTRLPCLPRIWSAIDHLRAIEVPICAREGLAAGFLGVRPVWRSAPAPLLLAGSLHLDRRMINCTDERDRLRGFLSVVALAADRHVMIVARLLQSLRGARERVIAYAGGDAGRQRGLRDDSILSEAAEAAVELEVVTSNRLRQALRDRGHDVTLRAVQRTIGRLVEAGLLKEATGRAYYRVWVPADLPVSALRPDEKAGMTMSTEAGGSQPPAFVAMPTMKEPRPDPQNDWREAVKAGERFAQMTRKNIERAEAAVTGTAGSQTD